MPQVFSDVVVDNEIGRVIATRYLNEAKFVASGIVENQGIVAQGTAYEWIRETLFQNSGDGQVISIGSEFSLNKKSQAKYQIPKVWRGDAGLVDLIFEDIKSKAPADQETELANAISLASAQNTDGVIAAVINGFGKWAKANNTNYVDDKSNQVSFAKFQAAKAKRGDEGMFNNGIIVARSAEIHKLFATAQVAATANTAGAQAQDSVISTGNYVNGTVLGMTMLMSDKVALDSADSKPFIYLMERNSIGAKFSGAPVVRGPIYDVRYFGEVLQYGVSVAAGIKGMSYGGTITDGITNTQLATAGNWALAASDAKFVPVCVLAVNTTSL